MAAAAAVGDSPSVRSRDPAIRRFTSFGFGLAGSLILEVHRRRQSEPRRTPAELLLDGSSGAPGPALVDAVADWDMLLIPPEIDRDQVKGLARAAGKAVLDAAAERLAELAPEFPRNVREIHDVLVARASRRRPGRDEDDGSDSDDSPDSPAERAAWTRFLAAYDEVAQLRRAYKRDPSDPIAERLRWAEVELEDAVAIAGELEVHNIRWILA